MGQPSTEQLLQNALNLGLIDERQFQDVWSSLGNQSLPPAEAMQLLVRREMLTNYQVEHLIKGEKSGYFYGPYKILYAIGAGTFARVYRAVHRETGQIFALKVLRKRFADKEHMYNQFLREGKLGLTLRHENIVPIYDVVSDGKTYFMVMEFVEGWNLRDFVKIRRQVEPLQAVRLMKDITDGLRYAFEQGLTHRDLKLNNALVTSDFRAKLVDFGLAAMEDSVAEGADGEVANTRTVDYAALERATGVKKDDTRSDIYFLGCIFYNMLTGQPPLAETKDRNQRLSKQRFLDVVPIQTLVPTLPHWVCTVVNKAMMLDATRRYQTTAAMLHDLTICESQLANKDSNPDSEAAALAAMQNYQDEKQYSVMVVESKPKMQDIFRDGFKKAGYKVLVTGDPQRAVTRVAQDADAADCILFCAQGLGRSGLEGFNALVEDGRTNKLRAILLLEEYQKDWKDEALVADHRIVLTMPITMKQVRSALHDLLASTLHSEPSVLAGAAKGR
jgi:serine/threonine-protein kinase